MVLTIFGANDLSCLPQLAPFMIMFSDQHWCRTTPQTPSRLPRRRTSPQTTECLIIRKSCIEVKIWTRDKIWKGDCNKSNGKILTGGCGICTVSRGKVKMTVV